MHGAMGHVLCSGYTHKQQWRPSPPCEPRLAHIVNAAQAADMSTRAVVYCTRSALWKGRPKIARRNGTCPVQWVHVQATVATVTTVGAILGRALVPWGGANKTRPQRQRGASGGHVNTCSSVLRLVCTLERVSQGCMAQWDMLRAVGTRTNNCGDRHHRASHVGSSVGAVGRRKQDSPTLSTRRKRRTCQHVQ